MAIGSISGTSAPAATSRRSISEPTTRWRSRCGPRTIPFANTGSWALWSTRRTPHPSGKVYAGGPQMVEISRDGKRVYWTNSLYSTWDNQFYPDGVPGAEVMANASPSGGLELAKDYWVSFPDGYRAHQIRLEGGDCSTDSFCYPSV